MSEKLKQQLDNLSDENFKEILSILNSLIKGLPNEIKINTSIGLTNQNKEIYEEYIQNTLKFKHTQSLENKNINVNHEITILIHSLQEKLINAAYKEAIDINDFYEKLTLLPEQLKNKEKLKNLYTSDR